MKRLRSGNAAPSRAAMSRYASCSSVVALNVTPPARRPSSRRAIPCSSPYSAVNNASAAAASPCSADANSADRSEGGMSGFRIALRYLEQGVIPPGRITGTAIINEVIAMKFGSLVFAAIAALGGAAVGAAPLDKFVPPAVPSELAVYSNESAFLMAHAVGTQNYVCLPSGNTFAWTLFGPQATLFSEDGGQVITHFLSANPDEAGLPRATWQHSRDSSAVWAALSAMSTNAAYVDPNAIPWFLLRTV